MKGIALSILIALVAVVLFNVQFGSNVYASHHRPHRSPTPTSTATSTVGTPTATPTPVPSSTPTLPVITGTTYYVSPAGSDSNNGISVTTAWNTVQHASDTMKAGDGVIVEAGSYSEHPSITSNGLANSYIVYTTNGTVNIFGFTVTGNFNIINGFNISNQTAGDGVVNGYGVLLTGTATMNTIQNNTIHDLCQDGIFFDPTVIQNLVWYNTINHAEMSGINVDGTGNTVAYNDISYTSQYPNKNGGIYSVCSSRTGADADWIRFFGQNNNITNNNLHDIVEPSAENINPHTDCFQTWGSSYGTTTNIIINANYCRGQSWFNSNGGTNHIGSIEALDGAVGIINFSNNIFANLFQGLIQDTLANSTINFYSNTVDHISQEAFDNESSGTSPTDLVDNNIIYDSGNGGDSFLSNNNIQVANNDCIMRSGSACGTYPSPPPAGTLVSNPLFVNSGDSTGAGANYELQSTSPMINAGTSLAVTLPDYNSDFLGVLRSGFDIGAYGYPI